MKRASGSDGPATEAQLDAVTVLSELQTLLDGSRADDPEYANLRDRRLVAAAAALDLGLDAQAIQAIGRLSDIEMNAVRTVAEEFRTNDLGH